VSPACCFCNMCASSAVAHVWPAPLVLLLTCAQSLHGFRCWLCTARWGLVLLTLQQQKIQQQQQQQQVPMLVRSLRRARSSSITKGTREKVPQTALLATRR
jgi:hypothetical protein